MTNGADSESKTDYMAMPLADKKDMSGRIGETSRFIGFGLVALVFTIYGSDNTLSSTIRQDSAFLLNVAGLLGCLAILSDYLQYVCGYFSAKDAISRTKEEHTYDDEAAVYKGREFFFWAKQLFAFVGATIVIIAFAAAAFWPAAAG